MLVLAVLATLSAVISVTSFRIANANEGVIEVLSISVSSEFPDGMRFKAQIQSDNDIDSIAEWFGNPDWGLGLPFPEFMAWQD